MTLLGMLWGQDCPELCPTAFIQFCSLCSFLQFSFLFFTYASVQNMSFNSTTFGRLSSTQEQCLSRPIAQCRTAKVRFTCLIRLQPPDCGITCTRNTHFINDNNNSSANVSSYMKLREHFSSSKEKLELGVSIRLRCLAGRKEPACLPVHRLLQFLFHLFSIGQSLPSQIFTFPSFCIPSHKVLVSHASPLPSNFHCSERFLLLKTSYGRCCMSFSSSLSSIFPLQSCNPLESRTTRARYFSTISNKNIFVQPTFCYTASCPVMLNKLKCMHAAHMRLLLFAATHLVLHGNLQPQMPEIASGTIAVLMVQLVQLFSTRLVELHTVGV